LQRGLKGGCGQSGGRAAELLIQLIRIEIEQAIHLRQGKLTSFNSRVAAENGAEQKARASVEIGSRMRGGACQLKAVGLSE
jgi:hypothetical protein